MIENLPPLVLASASPRRAELLEKMELEFQVVPSQAEEEFADIDFVPELCERNARHKAAEVAEIHPECLVIGADTLVYLDEEVFGKPADLQDARQMLARLSGRTHQVTTGVCLIHLNEEREKCFSVITNVTFLKLTKSGIDAYLKTINPLDKAGAYAIQENRELIIKRVSGSLSNVIGLPVERLKEELTVWNGVPAGEEW